MIPNSPLVDVLDSGNSVANPAVITVYFIPAGGTWVENGVTYTSQGWTQYEIDQAILALEEWANVANVTFQITTNQAAADFELGNAPISALGYFYYPGNYAEAGIGVFNPNGQGWDDAPGGGLEQGGYGFITLIHEFGHGLGLAHSHSDHGSSAFPGVTSAFNDLGDFDLNQGIYTTMSYNDGWANGPTGSPGTNDYGYQGTPMAVDIATVQQIYGANTSYNTGDNTYVLPDVNASGTFYSSIWDAGGTDAIIYNGVRDVTINLNDATLQVEEGGGGFMSYATGIHGGMTIANGVVIENASGGTGNDTLTGNEVGNVLDGNGGNDVINGEAGSDQLNGGGGNDTLNGGDAGDVLNGGAGSDTLSGDAGADTLNGEDDNDAISGGAGSDTLNGGAGNDALDGDADGDVLNGGAGDDMLDGGLGDDNLMGDAGDDMLVTGLGNDTLNGGADEDQVITFAGINVLDGGSGNDYLAGGIQADTLNGGAGNDVLQGEQTGGFLGGSDVINGGAGDDMLMGGVGADVFVFAPNDGNDMIAGFDGSTVTMGASGASATAAYVDFTDEVDLVQLNGFATVNAGNVDSFITDGADGAVFSAEGTEITFYGVAAADLTADDFIFV